ncbi:TY-Chap domain-containing protein [Thauera sp. ZXT1-4]|uniref:TY-Chap domain-containing protein n=1 Tax=Thauera sp. ZXT1-4 TaxID=3460294 RepID=UPI0040408079
MSRADSGRELSRPHRVPRAASRDWGPFSQNLEHVLGCLEEDQFLILNAKHGERYLQFSCQGAWGMRVEVASNHFLQGDDRLSRREMGWLRSHGWNAPTGTPSQATPEKDPDGSPNYHIDFPASVPDSDVAGLVIDTLMHGLGFPYPGALTYESFDANNGPLTFPGLGLKSRAGQGCAPMKRVLVVFRSVTGIEDLALDEDEYLAVRYGSIDINAFVLGSNVRLSAVLLTKVEESLPLLSKLNQINDSAYQLRCFVHDETVCAVLDVPSDPLVQKHLVGALDQFSEVAEGLAIVLRAEFSGDAPSGKTGPTACLQ